MNKNVEKIFLYFMYLICFGVFVSISNIKFLNNITLKYNYNNIIKTGFFIFNTICLTIVYYSVLGIIFSWILNFVYIASYRLSNYNIIAYNFFPIIYIKNNTKKIKLSFNLLLLNEIGSMIDIKDKINNEYNLNIYIENTKKVYSNLLYTHYILILVGIIFSIFNFGLGGMLILYNISLILFQSVEESDLFFNGYVYLSKNFNKDNMIYTLINLLKVQDVEKIFLYNFLQKNIMIRKINNIIVDEFYQTLMVDSISDNIDYMRTEVINKIDMELNQNAQFNEFTFLNHYRLYRIYCMYIFKFYGENQYQILINEMNKFYKKSKLMPLVKNMKKFEKDRILLNNNKFKDLNLKNKFDICNSFDIYINKLNKLSNINSSISQIHSK